MVKVGTFLGVFGFCLMVMTTLMINVGVEAPTNNDEDTVVQLPEGDVTIVTPSEYQSMPVFVSMLITALRNSLGDMSTPGYGEWSEKLKDNFYGASTMILLIWVIFVTNLYIMVVVLLNFLIAVISQVYEETISTGDISRYMTRSEMNVEAAVHASYV